MKLLVLALLLAVLKTGSCWSCYQCSSIAQEGCDRPFKPSQIGTVDCDAAFGEKTGCITYMIKKADEEHVRTIRNCAERGAAGNVTCSNIEKAVNKEEGSILLYCVTCHGNHCNAETMAQVALAWIIAAVILVIVLVVCCVCCFGCCRAVSGVV